MKSGQPVHPLSGQIVHLLSFHCSSLSGRGDLDLPNWVLPVPSLTFHFSVSPARNPRLGSGVSGLTWEIETVTLRPFRHLTGGGWHPSALLGRWRGTKRSRDLGMKSILNSLPTALFIQSQGFKDEDLGSSLVWLAATVGMYCPSRPSQFLSTTVSKHHDRHDDKRRILLFDSNLTSFLVQFPIEVIAKLGSQILTFWGLHLKRGCSNSNEHHHMLE